MKIKKSLPIIIVLIIGFLLRFHNYGSFPVYGESQDEMAWTWMGSSILQGKQPTSWSSTGATGYDYDETLSFGGSTYRVISPYFDNPHLFSLIPGFMAIITGHNQIKPVPITIVRFPMLLLACLNILLLYKATIIWFNKKTALLSAILLATIPSIVFSSRLVVAENLLITWMLLSWIVLKQSIKTKQKKWIIILGIISGLSSLTKISGLVILAANFILLLKNKQTKNAFKMAIIGLAIFSLYPIYGFLVNKDLFLQVLAKQSSQNIGLSGLLGLFVFPQLVRKTLVSGWFYLGLISLFLFLFSKSKAQNKKLISIFSLILFGFLLSATPEVDSNGWYKYPLFPIMTITISHLLLKTKQQIQAMVGLYLIVFLPTIRLSLISLNLSINPRYLIFLGFLPLLLNIKNKKTKKLIYYSFLAVLILINAVTVITFNKEIYWQDSLHFFPIRCGL